MEKKVLRETSFSPAFGFTEKDVLKSKKLMAEKNTLLQDQTNITWDYRDLRSLLQNTEVNLSIIWLFRDGKVPYKKTNWSWLYVRE